MTNIAKLDEITEVFGEAYDLAKETDETKKGSQKDFFEAATTALSETRLPRKTITVPKDQEVSAWVAKYHPGWRLLESKPAKGDGIKVIIERDPSLMKFTHVNLSDGRVYGRDETNGPEYLDDERVREEDPDLLPLVTEWPEPIYSIVRELLANKAAADFDEAIDKFLESKGIERVPIPPKSWSQNVTERARKFLVPGKVSVKLRPVRKAKDEELEEERARREDG
jgi:hypothetical protein